MNGPGCLACDLLNDFDHARRVAVEVGPAELAEKQRRLLTGIDALIGTMQEPDFECFNNEAVRRPVWQQLRELAAETLRAFGWEYAEVRPFVEVEPEAAKAPATKRRLINAIPDRHRSLDFFRGLS